MKRKDFIKKATFGGLSIGILSCINTGSGKNTSPKINCDETPEAEEGPFPTKEPEKFISKNIVLDRVGTALAIHIIIYNINNNCKPLKNAVVDIWHCDHKGEYSEYGGSDGFGPPPNGRNDMPPPPPPNRENNKGKRPPPPLGGMGPMKPADHTKEHFLRGRQQTNETGIALFTSIYPGWYGGRSPHIHAHIFNEDGKSLLISQIAFPENVSKEVYAQSVYAAKGQADTSNADDHVFNDSIANELATITGNLKDGFTLTHSIYVKA
jgi:protocatechuate 3,4-dioxygenase beta subunit